MRQLVLKEEAPNSTASLLRARNRIPAHSSFPSRLCCAVLFCKPGTFLKRPTLSHEATDYCICSLLLWLPAKRRVCAVTHQGSRSPTPSYRSC